MFQIQNVIKMAQERRRRKQASVDLLRQRWEAGIRRWGEANVPPADLPVSFQVPGSHHWWHVSEQTLTLGGDSTARLTNHGLDGALNATLDEIGSAYYDAAQAFVVALEYLTSPAETP